MKVIQSKVLVIVDKDTMTQKIGNFSVPVSDYEKAKVVGVGEEVGELKPDDIILIYPNSGKSFTHEGIEYRVITLNEIIVVL
jgi:hypothetical protein